MDVERALKVSCDIYFYNTGGRLGIDKIHDYARKLTFGEISHIDLDGERAGIVPSTEWAREKQNRKWYPSETISVSIGQGPIIVTPLQIANMTAAVANGGKVFQPHVVRYVDRVQKDGSYKRFRVPSRVLHEVTLAPAALKSVRDGLWQVVNAQGGTGSNARVDGLNIAGKTGSVQVIAYSGWIKADVASVQVPRPRVVRVVRAARTTRRWWRSCSSSTAAPAARTRPRSRSCCTSRRSAIG